VLHRMRSDPRAEAVRKVQQSSLLWDGVHAADVEDGQAVLQGVGGAAVTNDALCTGGIYAIFKRCPYHSEPGGI